MLISSKLIYALVDPRTHYIRYIGKSATGLLRPMVHWRKHEDTHKGRWIQQLRQLGTKYKIVILELHPEDISNEDLNASEAKWIAWGWSAGFPLTNLTPGGDGFAHGELNVAKRPEVRMKISEALLGHEHSHEAKLKMREARLGKPGPQHDPETIERIRQSNLGQKRSQETIEKNRLAQTGKKHTDEAKAKMSAWRTGENNVSKRPEVRAKISESHKNNPKVKANIERLSAARRIENVECGTRLGYARANLASKKGEPNCGPCDACKRAAADYAKSKRPPLKEKVVPACGTTAAYTAAIKARAKGGPNCGPCEPCRDAKRAYDKARGH